MPRHRLPVPQICVREEPHLRDPLAHSEYTAAPTPSTNCSIVHAVLGALSAKASPPATLVVRLTGHENLKRDPKPVANPTPSIGVELRLSLAIPATACETSAASRTSRACSAPTPWHASQDSIAASTRRLGLPGRQRQGDSAATILASDSTTMKVQRPASTSGRLC